MNIEIRHGRVIDPAAGSDGVGSLYIVDGRIAGFGQAPAGFVHGQVIDAAGLVVCPGLVDLSARVGGSGGELRAAAAGGVTSVCCPPDTRPPLDEPGLVERLVGRARTVGLAHVHPVGALTVGLQGQSLTAMLDLAAAGCVAFSQAECAIGDTRVLYRALQYASTFDLPVWLRAEDPFLAADGVAHDGEVAARLGLPGIPACAESIALNTLLVLAAETGARLHVRRLSTAAGVDMIRRARAAGSAVSADVTVHHLHLCEADIGFFDSRARLDPPLRAADDRAALRAGLADGTLAAVCSDHTPVAEDGKQMPFAEADAGAVGLQLLLPLTLRWAAESGVDLATALRRITAGPAQIAGLTAGTLAAGAAADICIFDPQAVWQVGAESLHGGTCNTPFFGHTMHGRVEYTLLDGRVVFSARESLPD